MHGDAAAAAEIEPPVLAFDIADHYRTVQIVTVEIAEYPRIISPGALLGIADQPQGRGFRSPRNRPGRQQAEKQAAELKKNTEAELKLFATQSVEALKSEVVNLITGKITSSNVKAIVSDTAFMQKVILEMAKEWVVKEAITIRTADADALTKYFEANAKSLLDGGVKIEKVSGHDASFTIVPADGSYKVSFGEDEFVAFFKEFLRPGLVEMLF